MYLEEMVRLWPETVAEARIVATSHLARYEAARSSVQGKSICDIACGAGYGSRFLAQWAKSVVGMDISDSAIDWANKHFQSDNLFFHCADGSKTWPVQQQFDVITSFETLEHVSEPESFLRQLDKHLSLHGKLFMSVPNGPRDKKKTDNPYHLHHFDVKDFENLVGDFFDDPQYYSQVYRKNWKHYAAKMQRKLGLVKNQKYFLENYHMAKGLDLECKTWFVVARKRIR